MGFWDFMGIGNSAERRQHQAQADIMNDLATQQQAHQANWLKHADEFEQQAARHEANIGIEEQLGREAAQSHREVKNIDVGAAAAKEAEMAATAQQNAAQRALGGRGGAGAGALAGMTAAANAREGAMASAFSRQQGRQDQARSQLEQSKRATRQAVGQQENAAMQARQGAMQAREGGMQSAQNAAQSRMQAEESRGQIMTSGEKAGQLFGNIMQMGSSILSDERYKDFRSPQPKTPGVTESDLNRKVLRLLKIRKANGAKGKAASRAGD